jgi:hypothetical protein
LTRWGDDEWRFSRLYSSCQIIAYYFLADDFSSANFKKIKKSLPNVAVPGIPRFRAATDLLGIGNYLSSCDFQRSNARAGVGSFNIGFNQSRSEDSERPRASDHE